MTILLAFLIAMVAVSLMMTVLIASTRPLRAYDEPIFGTRSSSRAQKLTRGPNWMELDGAPRPIEPYTSSLPLPAPVAPSPSETTGSRAATHRVDVTQPRPMARGSGRINPNSWGRVRAEVGVLETKRNQAGSASA